MAEAYATIAQHRGGFKKKFVKQLQESSSSQSFPFKARQGSAQGHRQLPQGYDTVRCLWPARSLDWRQRLPSQWKEGKGRILKGKGKSVFILVTKEGSFTAQEEQLLLLCLAQAY